MIKDILLNNEAVTSNAQTLKILHTHFPQCFNKEGNFDIDKFKDSIRADVDVTHEGYDLNFLGKNYAKLLASVDTTTVIQPDVEHNTKPENANSQNLYISGDNLDGLKHLLKSYAGAVKCIYIDPPYNTGSDGFVYNDNFNYSAEELTAKLSISDEQAQKILDLTTKGRASHSAWLTFMSSRLLLARDLLKAEGVIFISIDDNEQSNLKLLCDSIFGEENFVEVLKWKKKKQPSFLATHTAKVMEYVLVYSKNKEKLEKLSIDGTSDSTKKVINVSNKECERLFKSNCRVKGAENRVIKAGRYKIKTMEIEYLNDIFVKNGYSTNEVNVISKFSVSQDKIDDYIKNDLLFITAQNGLRRDVAIEEIGKRKSITDLLLSDWGDNQESDKEFIDLFGEKYFDYNKPVLLVKNLILSNYTEDEIVLDFFSGSATTAEAVMRANLDDGNRKYFLIQLPENLDNTYESANPDERAKFKKLFNFLDSVNRSHNLDQIGIERITRAAVKIKTEKNADIDYGFKHYTLVEPSNDTIDKLEDFNEGVMFTDNDTLSLFGKETVLETWLVKDGYGFGAKVQEVKLADYTAYLCGKHLYFIEAGINENDMVALLDKYQQEPAFSPENIVVFGYSFNFSQTEMLRKNLFVLKDSQKNLKANFDIRY
ncbi:MAG: site-specific DNA-methyltransferase [Paludibacter sp.]|nr:site-specific DNA-methyltransferase [Paludibacter sp.]